MLIMFSDGKENFRAIYRRKYVSYNPKRNIIKKYKNNIFFKNINYNSYYNEKTP